MNLMEMIRDLRSWKITGCLEKERDPVCLLKPGFRGLAKDNLKSYLLEASFRFQILQLRRRNKRRGW